MLKHNIYLSMLPDNVASQFFFLRVITFGMFFDCFWYLFLKQLKKIKPKPQILLFWAAAREKQQSKQVGADTRCCAIELNWIELNWLSLETVVHTRPSRVRCCLHHGVTVIITLTGTRRLSINCITIYIGGSKMVLFTHGRFWNKYKIYPKKEKDHFGTMRKNPARRCRAGPQGRARAGPGPRAPGGRPGTSEPGPKMVFFRMVPKWSFSFFGYILYLFQKGPWLKRTILGPPIIALYHML